MKAQLPHIRIDAQGATSGPRERWGQWQASMAPFFEVETDGPDEFSASADFWALGPVVWGRTRVPRIRYARSRRKVASTGLDQYLIQHCHGGGSRCSAGGREMVVRPGDVGIIDLSSTCESQDGACTIFSLIVPRSLLDEVGSAELHGTVIRGETPTGSLLREFLVAVEHSIPGLANEDASGVVEATMALLTSAVRSETRNSSRARPLEPILKALRVRRYVRRNLLSPELTAASIAARFELSRAQLYRYFEPDGGVDACIRSLRLRRCFEKIADPVFAARSIQEIAAEHGFDCEAHFSRLFRRTFGITASEVRRAGRAGMRAAPDNSRDLAAWVRSLE